MKNTYPFLTPKGVYDGGGGVLTLLVYQKDKFLSTWVLS